MEKNNFTCLVGLLFYLILVSGFNGCAGSAVKNQNTGPLTESAPASPEAETAYQKAEALFNEGKFSLSYKILKNLRKQTKNQEQQERIMFLKTETVFRMEKYESAYDLYEQYLTLFPKSAKLPQVIERQFEIGFIYLTGLRHKKLFGLGLLPGTEWGMNVIRTTLQRYPYAEPAEKYHLKLCDILFEQKLMAEARLEYESFRKTYPKSESVPRALFQTGRCYLSEYLGTNYDKEPLINARGILEKFLSRYSQHPLAEQVNAYLKEIISALAERDYEIACFYLRSNQPDAALIYFNHVIKNYPETKWAAESQEQLKNIK